MNGFIKNTIFMRFMENEIQFIEFNKESLPEVLDLFDCEVTDEGKIIDKFLKEPIKDGTSLEELSINNFGGILPSSRLFIAKDIASIMEHIAIKQEMGD